MRKLFSLTSFNTDIDKIIKVLACGYCNGPEELIPREGRVLRDQYVIHYFTRGKGYYRDRRHPHYAFEDDHVVIFYPGLRHFIAPADHEELEHYYVLFSGTLPQLLLQQFEEQGVAIFPIRKNPLFRDRFMALMNGASILTQLSVHNANALLYMIINETLHLYQDASKGAGPGAEVEAFVAFVTQNGRLPELDLQWFLKSRALAQKTFAALFKRETGITPHQYWLSWKISQAKSLLSGSRKSVKEIAAELGFQDEFYFSRLFKRKEGVSPKAFRASLYT
jgi:AraC-like DNA-binding protein